MKFDRPPGALRYSPNSRCRAARYMRVIRLSNTVFLSLFFGLACNGYNSESSAPELSREAFIQAYVTLSITDMENVSRRDQVLDSLGVSSTDLEEFVAYHGKNVDFMADLWDEINSEIDQALNLTIESYPSP